MRRRGSSAIEMIVLLPVTISIILVLFWIARIYAAKHVAWIESSTSVLENAHKVHHSGNQQQTMLLNGIGDPDLSHFLAQWPSRKNLRRGLVGGEGVADTGRGVGVASEGLGEIESEDWLLADTWKDAFVFPESKREQPRFVLPNSVQAIVPRTLPRLSTGAFTSLLQF